MMSEGNKPPEPTIGRKVLNLAKAVTRHAIDGGKKVEEQIYQQRLEVCRRCDSCDLDRIVCREMNCGCYLRRKARWRSENCPREKWDDIEADK